MIPTFALSPGMSKYLLLHVVIERIWADSSIALSKPTSLHVRQPSLLYKTYVGAGKNIFLEAGAAPLVFTAKNIIFRGGKASAPKNDF